MLCGEVEIYACFALVVFELDYILLRVTLNNKSKFLGLLVAFSKNKRWKFMKIPMETTVNFGVHL